MNRDFNQTASGEDFTDDVIEAVWNQAAFASSDPNRRRDVCNSGP